jgi:hypothetical protein
LVALAAFSYHLHNMTIKNMFQAPLCGKRQLAAESRMAAGLATALAFGVPTSISAFACCRLMPETSKHPKKNSRRKKLRRLKLNSL